MTYDFSPLRTALIVALIQRGANLSGADLSRADLSGADLSGTNLTGANLYGANLYGANLSGADLRWADLSGADLRWADLYEANLFGANLTDANLRWANLYGADLFGAYLFGANLSGATLPDYNFLPEGEITVYKKLQDDLVAELVIGTDVRRTCSLVGGKCRAESAFVKSITDETGAHYPHGCSIYNGTLYEVGSTVVPDFYDDDIRVECTNGIHFFATREEAEAY